MGASKCPICAPLGVASLNAGTFTGTPRERIAACCNHVMLAHAGGSVDAWEAAKAMEPFECALWEAEVMAS